MEYGVVI